MSCFFHGHSVRGKCACKHPPQRTLHLACPICSASSLCLRFPPATRSLHHASSRCLQLHLRPPGGALRPSPCAAGGQRSMIWRSAARSFPLGVPPPALAVPSLSRRGERPDRACRCSAAAVPIDRLGAPRARAPHAGAAIAVAVAVLSVRRREPAAVTVQVTAGHGQARRLRTGREGCGGGRKPTLAFEKCWRLKLDWVEPIWS